VNGYIRIRKGQNNKTGEIIQEIVNNNGDENINIELEPDVYTLEVGASGYSTSFNTITIVGDEIRDYEFSITPILSNNQVRIVLTWGETPSDLDSHLLKKVNDSVEYHLYYANSQGTDGDNLDIDDTDSYGPETVTINNLDNSAIYKYHVHDFSNSSNTSDEILKASGAKVDVIMEINQKLLCSNQIGNAWKYLKIGQWWRLFPLYFLKCGNLGG